MDPNEPLWGNSLSINTQSHPTSHSHMQQPFRWDDKIDILPRQVSFFLFFSPGTSSSPWRVTPWPSWFIHGVLKMYWLPSFRNSWGKSSFDQIFMDWGVCACNNIEPLSVQSDCCSYHIPVKVGQYYYPHGADEGLRHREEYRLATRLSNEVMAEARFEPRTL